ncbi:MBL fold metallo-hydrolase [Dactylosporangium sp. NPDC051484]|uniref:MBL fold metallo-hydrolase n=1 Tax=Dactylosporangium sp. NPDC051484 TaxID=3154942 RepID=UPI0034504C73
MTTALSITKLSVGPMDNNAYLLRCRATGEGVLIDAANEAPRLLQLVEPEGIRAVVTTHRHPDHWMALAEVIEATGAQSLAHPADAPEIPVVTGTLNEDDTLRVGDCTLSVIHLVGHTPGSIALYYEPDGGHLFTGDALFPGGPGRTTNPTDFNSLMDDLEEKVFGPLPDSTVIYPGHGKDSTIGAERPALPQWRARGW